MSFNDLAKKEAAVKKAAQEKTSETKARPEDTTAQGAAASKASKA